MVAHQAPHAPHTPLWRRVISLPRTRLGWWAVGLAGPSLVLTVGSLVSDVLGLTFLPHVLASSGPSGFSGITWLLSAVAGGVVGVIAVAHERSWLVWVAMVPGMIIFSFFIWAFISFSIGHDADPWVTFPISVLLWAVMVFNIPISTRKSEKSR